MGLWCNINFSNMKAIVDYILENQFLLACSKAQIENRVIFDALDSPLDWDYICRKAEQHGIAQLLYSNLNRLETVDKIPTPVWQKLEKTFYNIQAINTVHYDELKKILQSFSRAGIRAMVLKGAALAEQYYKDIALRPMADIDLLIHEDEWVQARNILSGLGYAFHNICYQLSKNEIVDYSHYRCQIRCWKSYVLLEIHFRLFNLGIVKPEDNIWQRAQLAKIAGVDTLIPSSEDMLLHLLIHANIHKFYRLIWFVDVCQVLEKSHYKIDWQYIVDFMHHRKLTASGYCTLSLLKDTLGCGIPFDMLSEIKPSRMRKYLFDKLWNLQGARKLSSSKRPMHFEAPLFYLLEMDSFADKVEYIFRILFPPLNWLGARSSTTA